MTAAHDRSSLKKIAPSEVAHQRIRTLRVGGFDGTRAATAAPRASSASAKVCGSGTGLRFGGGALAAAALRTATTYRSKVLLKLFDPPVSGEKARAICDDDDVPDQYKLVPSTSMKLASSPELLPPTAGSAHRSSNSLITGKRHCPAAAPPVVRPAAQAFPSAQVFRGSTLGRQLVNHNRLVSVSSTSTLLACSTSAAGAAPAISAKGQRCGPCLELEHHDRP